MFARWSAALALASVALFPSRPSLACSPPFCAPAHVAPAATASIPAKVPALAFIPTVNGTGPSADIGFEVRDVNGVLVPATVSDDPAAPGTKLVVFVGPLGPGSYKLHYNESCNGGAPQGDGGAGKPMAQPFTVLASTAPLPTVAGTLTVASQGVQTINVTTVSGSCTSTIQAATAKLSFTPSAGLLPYLPLARIITRVDGKEWSRTRYGDELRDGSMQFDSWRRVHQLHARCVAPAQSYDDDGLTVGMHHIEVVVHVAGATSDPPPLQLDVNLTCDGATLDGGTMTTPPLSTGGCSVGSGNSAGFSSLAALALLLLAFALRRLKV